MFANQGHGDRNQVFKHKQWKVRSNADMLHGEHMEGDSAEPLACPPSPPSGPDSEQDPRLYLTRTLKVPFM